jgi:hypothetical protein
MLFGIYGTHTTRNCPLNDRNSAESVLDMSSKCKNEQLLKEYKINKIIGQYHSALEHWFLWILEAEDVHLIEKFCIDIEMAKYNRVKIVPLNTFEAVVQKISYSASPTPTRSTSSSS